MLVYHAANSKFTTRVEWHWLISGGSNFLCTIYLMCCRFLRVHLVFHVVMNVCICVHVPMQLALTLPEMAHSLDLAVDMVKLVDISDGLSCAEMAAVCREACMQPVDELQASLLQGDVVMEGDAVQLRKLLWQDFEVAFARCQSVKAQQLEQSSQVA